MSLPADYIRRAVYATYLLRRASELLRQRTLLANAEALLALHDGVEMMMRVVGDYLRVKQFHNFMDFWPRVKDVTGKEPPHRAAMDRLNDARNSFKHKGIPPDRTVVASFQTLVEEFCADLGAQYLDLDFSRLSMAELVSRDTVRALVQESETLYEKGSQREALEKLALAFSDLYSFAKHEAEDVMMDPPKQLSYLQMPDSKSRELFNTAQQLVEDHEKLAETMNMLLLGVDPHRFIFFRRLTPGVTRFASGTARVSWHASRLAATIDESTYLACRDFVVDFSLRNDELFRP